MNWAFLNDSWSVPSLRSYAMTYATWFTGNSGKHTPPSAGMGLYGVATTGAEDGSVESVGERDGVGCATTSDASHSLLMSVASTVSEGLCSDISC
jgi:hypothetical protein